MISQPRIFTLTTHRHDHQAMSAPFLFTAIIFFALALVFSPAAHAATQQEFDMAVDLGDYEAAIPPLERLLISNPDTPKLKLELGILYYLLGSYDVAKQYLHDAKSPKRDGSMPKPEIIAGADEYLNRM